MTNEQLEQRLAAIERQLLEVQRAVGGLSGPDPATNWWESLPPLSDELRQCLAEMAPYSTYIRQTGDVPPPDWKPGDPIPEPDHWQ